jgi:mRNA-degrading endonuclease RelE of RelBE toxin-antitoxin system
VQTDAQALVANWEDIMKKVVITPPVEIALRTLDPDNVRSVQSWFTRLANWDHDPFVRSDSHSLDSVPGVYLLKTSTDIRIFFKMDGDTITILDIARKQSILTSGSIPEVE